MWRYHALRLPDRAWLHRDLPLRGVKLSPAISGPFSLSAAIDPDYAELIGEDGRPLLQEWGTLILAEVDDVIRGGGIVTSLSTTGPLLEIGATGFSAYPGGQPLMQSLTWGGKPAGQTGTGVDPMDVVRALWAHLQGLPGGNLGVAVDGLSTPYRLGSWFNARKLATSDDPNPKASDIEPEIPIDRVWTNADRKPAAATGQAVHWHYALYHYDNVDIGAKVEELSKQVPLDWREHYTWTDADKTDVALRLEFGHPRLGSRLNLRFVEGENITDVVTVTSDAEEYANVVVARGAGEGATQLVSTVSAPDGRLRRAASVDRGEATTQAALQALAREELGRVSTLDDITSFTVDGSHPNAPIGSFEPGDEVFVQTHIGWREVGLWVRVLSFDYEPESTRITVSCTRVE